MRVHLHRALALLAGSLTCFAILRASPTNLSVGGATIEVTIDPGPFELRQDAILRWISTAAENVTTYYGRFSIKKVRIVVHSAPGGDGVSHGTTFGWGGPHIRITVGEHATQEQLNDDWMMTHELVHLAFPDVAEQHHWIEEGIATYVEPVARAQRGQLTDQEVWSSFVRDMPQGQPKAGDRGLDNTHTWGRTYWGGALFCLVADVRIREATSNRLGFEDALRAILDESGGIESHWNLSQAFAVGDKATGTEVLTALYAEMKDAAVTVGLKDLWSRLDIQTEGNQIKLLDSGPPAEIRKAITMRPKSQVQSTWACLLFKNSLARHLHRH